MDESIFLGGQKWSVVVHVPAGCDGFMLYHKEWSLKEDVSVQCTRCSDSSVIMINQESYIQRQKKVELFCSFGGEFDVEYSI